jgi:hypothetical protein
MVTISPEFTVSTGFSAALKYPTCTVCGLGISECSAAFAPGGANPTELATTLAVNRRT